jgi:hypothetical protein
MLGGDSGAVVGWKGEADADILAQTWSLQLPLRVQVAADSIISPDPLPPFYVSACGQVGVPCGGRRPNDCACTMPTGARLETQLHVQH